MGLLLNKNNKEVHILRTNHSVGRSLHNNLIISEADTSKSHASIYWLKGYWYIKDNSSNGSLLNGELIVHESRVLKKGDVIQFAKCPNSIFVLKEDYSPSSYLTSKQFLNKVILLKDGANYPLEQPIVSFFRLKNFNWILDNGEKEEALVDRNTYVFCDDEWLYTENEPLEDTLVYKEVVPKLLFDFYLSHDQENIKLILHSQETKCDLGKRVHNHLLFLLAQEKVNDIEADVDENSSGWITMDAVVDNLRKELMQPNIDQYYVNIMIHRIRKQLSKDLAFTISISDLIERDNGKLRFRYSNISINITQA